MQNRENISPVQPESIWNTNLPIEQRMLATANHYGLQHPPGSIVFVSHSQREGHGPEDTRAGNRFRRWAGGNKHQHSTAAQIAMAELGAMFPHQDVEMREFSFLESQQPVNREAIEAADVLMLSPYPTDIAHLQRIVEQNTSAQVIVGGAFPTRNPSMLVQVDPRVQVVVGRMEGTLPFLLSHPRDPSNPQDSGIVRRSAIGVGKFDPKRDYYSLERRGKGGKSNFKDNPAGVTVESILGCNEKCGFCSIASHVEQPRDPLQVVAELTRLRKTGVKYVLFADDNISRNSPESLEIIFSAIKKLGMAWTGEGSRELLQNPKLARLMGETNIAFLHGIDDLSANVDGANNQKARTPDCVIEDLKSFQQYGFLVFGSIVVGLDNHAYPATFIKIRDNARKIPIPFIVQTAVPYPGTSFHRAAQKSGRLTTDDLTKYDFGTIVYQPSLMTSDELVLGTRWLQRELSSPERAAQIVSRAILQSPTKFLKHPRAILSILLLSMDNGFAGLTTMPDEKLTQHTDSLLNRVWEHLPPHVQSIIARVS